MFGKYQTSITLYKNEYKPENDFKVNRIGGQRITMQYVLFGDFGCFYIRMYDENSDHVGTISINTTSDQIVEILKNKLANTVSKKDAKSRVVMAKEHHQYDIEELIALSKKKEGVK
jgi:translation initiation factor 2 beta subunit (eIF-2beta)/eIF-5